MNNPVRQKMLKLPRQSFLTVQKYFNIIFLLRIPFMSHLQFMKNNLTLESIVVGISHFFRKDVGHI